MSDPDPRPKRPIPLLLWALLGFVVVLGFMFTLKALKPQPDVVAPQGYIIVPDAKSAP